MKRWRLVATSCVLLLAFWAYSVVAEETGTPKAKQGSGPKMVLKEQAFDFKEVKEGEVIEHTFIVRNEGDQILEIKNVKPG